EPSQRIGRTQTPVSVIAPYQQSIFDFFHKVESIHWVDAHRFPTNLVVIKALTSYFSTNKNNNSNYKISNNDTTSDSTTNDSSSEMLFVHSTPRQIGDSKRKWISREHSTFLDLLQYSALSPG